MEQLVEHMAEDTFVGWGWAPGAERERRLADPGLGGERRLLPRILIPFGAEWSPR